MVSALRLRIAGALALVLAVNAAVVAALAWAIRQLAEAATGPLTVDLGVPATVGGLLLGACCLVVFQVRHGARAVVGELDATTVEGDGPRNLLVRVERLAAHTDVPVPDVAVSGDEEPVCLTVRRDGSPTVVVSDGLFDRLDDDELDAALAHEIAHVANRDVTVATAIASLVAVADRMVARERLLARVLGVTVRMTLISGVGIVILAVPILLLVPVFLVASGLARTLVAINAITLGLFANAREYAADRAAARLTGDPGALASALESIEDDRPARDARLGASAALGIVEHDRSVEDEHTPHPVERYLPDDSLFEGVDPDESRPPGVAASAGASVGTAIRRRLILPITTRVRSAHAPVGRAARHARTWRPATHPPTERRIERLRRFRRTQ